MTLPKLPQVNKKTEAKFGLKFRKWLMDNPQRTCAYEIKDTRGKATFNMKEWKPAQEDFAEAIRYSEKGVLIRTEGVVGLPDYIYVRNEPSYVVIKYPKGFVIIDAPTLALEKKRSKRVGLTFTRAKELSII